MKKQQLVPIKKVLGMINSCQTENQIEECKTLVNNYVKAAKKNGLANIEMLQERLDEELLQRQEALYLVKIFNV